MLLTLLRLLWAQDLAIIFGSKRDAPSTWQAVICSKSDYEWEIDMTELLAGIAVSCPVNTL
jgi:hypothetical protein